MRSIIMGVIFALPLFYAFNPLWGRVDGFPAVILAIVMFFQFVSVVQILNSKSAIEKHGYGFLRQTIQYGLVMSTIIGIFALIY